MDGFNPSQPPLTVERFVELEDRIFNGGGMFLESVRAMARHSGVRKAPVAVLLAVLARVAAVLPAGIGIRTNKTVPASPNVFLAFYGPPGAGKDSLVRAVRAALVVMDGNEQVALDDPVPLGSGEGITDVLDPGAEMATGRGVLFFESEISTLVARHQRQGSTSRATLLQMFNGDPLGRTNKGERVSIAGGSYTACVMVNVQPDKASGIVGGGDGLEDRFLWTTVHDQAPGYTPGAPEGKNPRITVQLSADLAGSGGVLRLGSEVTRRVAVIQRDNEQAWEVAGNGHDVMLQIKVAAGLAVCHGRCEVRVDDWERAGVVLEWSAQVRSYAREYQRQMAVEERVRDTVDRQEASGRAMSERVKKGCEAVVRMLERYDSVPMRQIRDANNVMRGRQVQEEVMEVLEEEGIAERFGDRPKMVMRGPGFDDFVRARARGREKSSKSSKTL